MQRNVVDSRPNTILLVSRPELGNLVEIVSLDRIGVDLEYLVGLVVFQTKHSLERKLRLSLVQDVKNDHVVPSESQPMNGPQDRFRVCQQIAEEHHQPAMPDHAGDLVQTRLEVRRSRRLQLGEDRQDVPELRPLARRGEALPDLLIERHQPHRVLLPDHQVTKGRRQADPVFKFRQLLSVSVPHRRREIHHEVARQIRLGLEFLDVKPVGLGVHVPVDVSNVVTGRVLAMLGEFHRETLERAGVQPRDEPLDNESCAQIQPRNLPDHLRLQIFLRSPRHNKPPDQVSYFGVSGSRISVISLWTNDSVDCPSAWA